MDGTGNCGTRYHSLEKTRLSRKRNRTGLRSCVSIDIGVFPGLSYKILSTNTLWDLKIYRVARDSTGKVDGKKRNR